MSRAPSRRCTLVAVAAIALASTAPAAGQSLGERLPVEEITLENGMRVLLLPRPGAPTVSFVMQFGVGGVHERLGSTGIAHLLEHMLFKGTETIGTTDVEAERALFALMDGKHEQLIRARANGDEATEDALADEIDALEDQAREYVIGNEYDRVLTRAGALGLNAMTSSEATTYFVELPSNRIELFFALEADRMSNPVFREFYSERDVVTEERRMRVETSPAGALYEAHLAAAFTMHPYGVPVVGYMSDLETLSREQVESYYRRYYGPGNAVLAVVGAFDPQQVAEWTRSYLGQISPGEEPPPVLAVEPGQRGERRIALEWDAEPRLRIGWHVPESAHTDTPALAVLSSVLTGGRTSRLHRRLVTDEQIATSIFSSMGPGSLYPRLFQIDAAPVHPATTADLERVIYEEVRTMALHGPDPDEVERVLNQIEAGAVRRIQSNLGLAFQLSESESLHGDWRETFRSSARLAGVTPDDVQRVAAEYLVPEGRTVATLVKRVAR